jgi:hypothetical protein
VRPESAPPAEAPAGRAGYAAALAAVLAAGLLVRVFAVGAKVLWFDEFLTANFTRLSWGDLLAAIRHEAHPPLYFLAAKAWAGLFGDGKIALKSLPLAAGMAEIALVADAVRRALGRLPAVSAAALVAFSCVQIDQSTDAKPYALLGALLALLLWAFVRAGREPDRSRWAWLALGAAAAAASTHFYGGVAAVALSAGALLVWRGPARKTSLAVLAMSAAVFAAWLPPALRLPRGASDYLRDIWGGVPAWAPLAVSARISLPGWRSPYPPMNGRVLPGISAVEIAGAVLVGAVLLAGFLSRPPASRERAGARQAVVWGLALLPGFLLLETALNAVDRPVGIPGRFEVVPQIGLALLAAAAVARLPRRAAAAAGILLSVFAAGCAFARWRPYSGPRAERREEEIVRTIQRRLPPGGSAEIVTLGLARPPFEYYRRGDPRIALLSYPRSQLVHAGWHVKAQSPADIAALEREAAGLAARVRADVARGVPVFVAERADERNGLLLSRLRASGLELVATRFADWFYILRPAAAPQAGKVR